uniref:Uncharacterized protein n=1 Tax=Romanomermis culicivorax TaxID=13658 RepID=A0A915K067_ROMCU
MQGEGTPPLQAIAGLAKGISGVTQRGQQSHCSCLSQFRVVHRLGISGGHDDEYQTLVRIDYSRGSSRGCHGSGSHYGSHEGHKGRHGHQKEQSVSGVDNGHSWWYRGRGKTKCRFACTMAIEG